MNELTSKLNLEISRLEALILFDLLSAKSTKLSNDSAEMQVLNNIECILEKNLSEVLDPNYKEILNQAKKLLIS